MEGCYDDGSEMGKHKVLLSMVIVWRVVYGVRCVLLSNTRERNIAIFPFFHGTYHLSVPLSIRNLCAT